MQLSSAEHLALLPTAERQRFYSTILAEPRLLWPNYQPRPDDPSSPDADADEESRQLMRGAIFVTAENFDESVLRILRFDGLPEQMRQPVLVTVQPIMSVHGERKDGFDKWLLRAFEAQAGLAAQRAPSEI